MKTESEQTSGAAGSSSEFILRRRIMVAEERSANWLAEANAARERGNFDRAKACDEKSAFWLMQANKLRKW